MLGRVPVRKVTAREMLGSKPLVLSAQPFHKALKRLADKQEHPEEPSKLANGSGSEPD